MLNQPRRSASAFRMSLNAKVKQVARATGRPATQLHREFYLLRFLGRVFADVGSPWVLKGGSGLLVRIADGARYSRDIDILRIDVDADQAVTELQQLCATPSDLDPLTFEVRRGKNDPATAHSAQLVTTVYYGATELHHFPIDLSIRPTLASDVDQVEPATLLELDNFADLPPFRCLSLADQIADKIAAMYEVHGPNATPSTRWHDLVDLLLIIDRFPIDAAETIRALRIQQQRRDHLTLPGVVTRPGSGWDAGYPREAAGTSLPPDLHGLDAALVALAGFADPLLDGTLSTGTWNPRAGRWDTTASNETY
ncbi:nucleotidyl transferase AbiEii/AbiGii toxin family protein [Nocardia colli]|uniref:Nucleotidyl transferase AbiEii/AbiGii toxin family protein n=1 Tax=Nocardia colli TaxID=2545717 RepID=A0A5N0EH60_9NOCA|nr:nucleotidyl transferase AbiEii/AbiGii toxin family protein [Nocardia colli]KAA8886691.1 nucleotidyl transferase AbiEii/AbiGii toxin family protein [Nocardia colli]